MNYEYNIFMFIYDNYLSKKTTNPIILNKEDIFKQYNSVLFKNNYKINYNYYKLLNIKIIRYFFNILFNKKDITKDDLKIYIPHYKLLLCKNEYSSYGIHRYGWEKVINEFLESNYTENDDFHYENPNFEWLQYALQYNLSNYKEAVSHFKINNQNKIKMDIFNINCIILDDWLEKTYDWGMKNSIKKDYHIKFISFIHDPPYQDILDNNNFSFTVKQKSIKRDIDIFHKEKHNLSILISLSNFHKKYLEEKKIYDSKIYFICHPLEYENSIEKSFDYEEYKANQKKQIYIIGWWLRKYNNFINLKNSNHEKNILIKNTEGNHVVDYILYEIRKSMSETKELSNADYQKELTDEEVSILKNKYNIKITSFLENKDYDNIFKRNIVFLDFYITSANNIILECILLNTPILIKLNDSVVDYLGTDYPFYFDSLEEAENKLNDSELIYKTHLYLKNMDKTKFTYHYFNNELHNRIYESFL